MSKKILHICNRSKIIPPFIELVKEYFNFKEHYFYLTGGITEIELKPQSNVKIGKVGMFNRFKEYPQLIIQMHQSKKIILHGLFDWRIVFILFLMPWLLKKSYWIIWGGDLYVYQIGKRDWKWKLKEFFRRPVIKKMQHLVTGTLGDFDLVRDWYGAKGEHISCFNYPSNIYKYYEIKPKLHNTINIQVGNSADPTNQHFEVFDQLEKFKYKNIKIFVVLSYGNRDYAKKVIKEGKKKFGDKFVAITDMMPFGQYLDFLASIDIAIFNHKRQQAFGNAITLLGLGKKVFLNQASTLNGVFNELGIQVFDSQYIELSPLDKLAKKSNVQKVQHHFSKKSLVKSLQKWVI